MFVDVSDREIFFSLKRSKFAAECDWNGKKSKTIQNSVYCFEKIGFFRKKILYFFKIAKCDKFLLECVSNGIISQKCLSTFFEVFFAEN